MPSSARIYLFLMFNNTIAPNTSAMPRAAARLSGASILNSGSVVLESGGVSIARANTPASGSSANLAGIGINLLYARADGGFDATADMTGASINAGSMSISSSYGVRADAAGKAPFGGVGFELSALSVKTNVAKAFVALGNQN